MKKLGGLQRFKQLPKRTRIFILAGVGLVFLTCCCILPLALPDSPEDETKVASISTLSLPSETSAVSIPTAAVPTDTIPAPTATLPAPPTSTTAPTETAAPLPTQPPLPKLNACLPENATVESATVSRVVDGDTINVVIAGKPFTVRYIGIDTPETKEPNTSVELYGPEAAQRNSELVGGKEVMLVKDVSETDRYDRLLRYVFVGDTFVNETLVEEGFAQAKAYPPDTACQPLFSAAQQAAKMQAIGMWAPAPVKAVEIATQPPAAGSDGCPQGCLEEKPGCQIKGNINSKGEKIYHDFSSSYSKTIIDPSKGERWFCTSEEAVSNGWRAPRN